MLCGRFRATISSFLGRSRVLSLVSGVVCVAVFFSALPARADMITFYPTSCLGGWYGPEHAQGQFSVLDRGDGEVEASVFTRENSAVLEGSAAQIFCGRFDADVPEDATVSGFTLIFSWDFKDPQSGQSLPSPLSVDGTEYAFKQAAAVAMAFYTGATSTVNQIASSLASTSTLSTSLVATTTILATDATSTANAILNLDTRQVAEVHIDFADPVAASTSTIATTTATAPPNIESIVEQATVIEAVQVENGEKKLISEIPPAQENIEVVAPVPVPEPVSTVEQVPPVPAAPESVSTPEPVEPASPVVPDESPQSFRFLDTVLSFVVTPVHAQEAEQVQATPTIVSEPAPQPIEAVQTVEALPVVEQVIINQQNPDVPVVVPESAVVNDSVIPTPVGEAPIDSPSSVSVEVEAAASTSSPVLEVDTSTTTLVVPDVQEGIQQNAIVQQLSNEDAPFLEVLYSIDGTTWRQLGTVSSQNWKYSRFALPITDWKDLEHLQITLQTLPVVGTMPTVYLDGIAVEANVLYSRKDPNPIPDLLADELIRQDVGSSYRTALIRRAQDVGQVELWVSEVVDPQSLRVLSGKNPLEAKIIQRALTSTTTSRFIRLAWRKVADSSLVGENTYITSYQRSVFWFDRKGQSMWRYFLDSNSYESVSIDPLTDTAEMRFGNEMGQTVRVIYNAKTHTFSFVEDGDAGDQE